MTARLIDGKALAEQYRSQLIARVRAVESRGTKVRLDAVLCAAGDNASRVYAENQGKAAAALGIEYKLHELPANANFDVLAGRVLLLNTREDVTAIMLHLPLPAGVEPYDIQRLIAPEKDVEGVNPANIGNIVYGRSSLAPCTALAVIRMIEHIGVELRGKRAVVIGASDHVGKPIAVLLMRQDATVVSCNKWTPGIKSIMYAADILVAAAGVPELIVPDCVKPGAIVIDVGVNRITGPDGKARTVGDVAFEQVRDRLGPEGCISPVPGGVGPMTVM
ncbi:MAG: bifunctional 5,10-methylenetetrahydrofolate dehydrogenase/5,10-methenyltetrahydrofolate cyclohydrolase, partial [Phycisphaerales bacterium]|nr:bifunctional 5,10-methylenetetrahydrofolate dehydrogenase/5,10-methenyltetrahydrofolate cyclohydrolase [Phycisphaerales bacterium]